MYQKRILVSIFTRLKYGVSFQCGAITVVVPFFSAISAFPTLVGLFCHFGLKTAFAHAMTRPRDKSRTALGRLFAILSRSSSGMNSKKRGEQHGAGMPRRRRRFSVSVLRASSLFCEDSF